MEIKQYQLSELIPYEDNPRSIDVHKFEALKQSILDMPDMIMVRPLIIDMKNNILCGNMRYLAYKELGFDVIPAKQVDLPEDKIKELVIKDNLSYGEWDVDALEFNWNMDLVDRWLGNNPIDYSEIDYEDLTTEIESMQQGVKKAIQVEINAEHYDHAKDLERICRERHIYIGGELIAAMEQIKSDYENNTAK